MGSAAGWGAGRWRAVPAGGGAPGPHWTSFTFSIPLPNDQARLAALALSLRLPGSAAVELDNLSFALNGQPYVPAGPLPPPAPTAAEIAWLRAALHPLRTPAPADPDLAALGGLVGAARLVGLGEAAPGSHETLALKSRLVRYFISREGFTGVLLDTNPAAGAALNDYLQTGQGDPARLLAALGTSWATAETRALVAWLRAYNQAHSTKVFVAGVAPAPPEAALGLLSQTVAADDDFAQPRLRQLAHLLPALRPLPAGTDLDLRHHPDQPQDSLLPAVRRWLAELGTGLDTRAQLAPTLLAGAPPDLRARSRQRHYLRQLAQSATLTRLPPELAPNYRAACLAENVQWLRESAPGGPPKLLLWADNEVVARAAEAGRVPAGQWLRASYGADYFGLGLALGRGRYAARQCVADSPASRRVRNLVAAGRPTGLLLVNE